MDKETETTIIRLGHEMTKHLQIITQRAGLHPDDMVPVVAAVIGNVFGALKAVDQDNASRLLFGLYGGMIGLGAAMEFHRLIDPADTHKFLYPEKHVDDKVEVKH